MISCPPDVLAVLGISNEKKRRERGAVEEGETLVPCTKQKTKFQKHFSGNRERVPERSLHEKKKKIITLCSVSIFIHSKFTGYGE